MIMDFENGTGNMENPNIARRSVPTGFNSTLDTAFTNEVSSLTATPDTRWKARRAPCLSSNHFLIIDVLRSPAPPHHLHTLLSPWKSRPTRTTRARRTMSRSVLKALSEPNTGAARSSEAPYPIRYGRKKPKTPHWLGGADQLRGQEVAITG
ncbi:hypothetical protein TIFTF001_029727 [Ficus carica]|uniref:Uncharacterized protein n=1 Tax=Ficus carica TaxID=3494 RepID=A0AA88DSV3_FICCA|nr:hypothetical protein TIFTF001_029727 [Ficus carica]